MGVFGVLDKESIEPGLLVIPVIESYFALFILCTLVGKGDGFSKVFIRPFRWRKNFVNFCQGIGWCLLVWEFVMMDESNRSCYLKNCLAKFWCFCWICRHIEVVAKISLGTFKWGFEGDSFFKRDNILEIWFCKVFGSIRGL